MAEENKEQPSQEQPQAEVEFVFPDPEDQLFTTYANNIQLGWTHSDVRMVFGEVVDSTPKKVTVEQRAHITISYLQAKVLMLMLAQAIAQYETVFGEVKMPAGSTTFKTASTEANVTPGVSARR